MSVTALPFLKNRVSPFKMIIIIINGIGYFLEVPKVDFAL